MFTTIVKIGKASDRRGDDAPSTPPTSDEKDRSCKGKKCSVLNDFADSSACRWKVEEFGYN